MPKHSLGPSVRQFDRKCTVQGVANYFANVTHIPEQLSHYFATNGKCLMGT